MANEKLLKFYRAENAPSNPKEGYIWFNPTLGSISIYKTNTWENYSGLLDADYSDNILTITKKDGTALTVDLGNISSIGDLSTRLGKVEGQITTINGNMDTLTKAVGTMTGIVDEIPNKVSTEVTNQLKSLDATVYSTGESTDPDFKTEASKNKRVAVKVVQTDGKITGVEVFENDIATATSVGEVNSRIDTLTSTFVGDKKDKDGNLVDQNKSIRTIATDVLTEVLVKENADAAYDSLEEMSAWLQSHPESAAAMNQAVSKNTADISNLSPRVQELEESFDEILSAFEDNEEGSAGLFNVLTDRISNAVASVDNTTSSYLSTTLNDKTEGEGDNAYTIKELVIGVTTGSVSENDNALAVASDVKSYVDACIENGLTWAEY